MQIKLIADNFVSDGWPNPQKGQIRDVSDAFAHHLIGQGLAIQLKIEAPTAKKPEPPSSVSQAAPVSLETTAPRRRGRPKKLSR